MRGLPSFFILTALLSGCTVLRIDQRPIQNPAEEPAGEIRFLADKGGSPRQLSNGYRMTVMKDFSIVGEFESTTAGPTTAEGLRPGTYDISVAGRGIGTHSTQVKVRAGKATIVRLMVVNARRLTRCGETALTAGKVVLYAIGGVVGGIVYVAMLIATADDDDDDGFCLSDRSPEGKKDQPSPRPGAVGPYRKKN